MDSIASKIEERIRSWERGRIFFINDFADLGSAEVVRQTLNRLTKAEVILRPGRGVYCYPKEYGKEMKSETDFWSTDIDEEKLEEEIREAIIQGLYNQNF